MGGDSVVSSIAPNAIDRLLAVHRPGIIADAKEGGGRKLTFVGVGRRDVYNPTAPFKASVNGKATEVMVARVEARESEESEAMFFVRRGDQWQPLPVSDAPVMKLQDPFVCKVGGEWVVGGVQTFPKPEGGLGYRTVFRKGKDITDFKTAEPFAVGPDGMKDIRLASLPNGKVVVLTRPQGEGNPGKVGFTILEHLSELGPESIKKAKVYDDLFAVGEWGGANELHVLKNGLIGVLGHVAKYDGLGRRHYYAMAFAIDPVTGRHSPMKLIAERSEFPDGPAKRDDLVDILFSGGLVRKENGRAVLFVGASDTETHQKELADPMLELEAWDPTNVPF